MSNIQAAKQALNQAQRAFEIAKANLAFARMNKTEQRITIAQDVIAALKAKEIIAKQRTYLELLSDSGTPLYQEDAETELAKRNVPNGCEACALGAVFVCALKRDQTVETKGLFDDDEQEFMQEKLAPYFSEEQLDLIEAAFERHYYGEREEDEYGNLVDYNEDELPEDAQRAIAFGRKYGSADKRLMAIMQNIVKNKGLFKP